MERGASPSMSWTGSGGGFRSIIVVFLFVDVGVEASPSMSWTGSEGGFMSVIIVFVSYNCFRC